MIGDSTTPNLDRWAAMQAAIVPILKARFPNLTVEETLKLTNDLIRAMVHAIKELP